jgi:hypothetical protein
MLTTPVIMAFLLYSWTCERDYSPVELLSVCLVVGRKRQHSSQMSIWLREENTSPIELLVCLTNPHNDFKATPAKTAGHRVVILGKSQPAKNRNLSRLISNISRINWSSERNTVCCFSTVFTL